MNIREVAPTDTVRVTVYRRYGEEAERSDTWEREVSGVDIKTGQILTFDCGKRWISVEGMNADGTNPAYTDTRLQVRKNVQGAKFERVYL